MGTSITEQLYDLAVQRVENTSELAGHADFILADWSNWREHLEWVTNAPISDILAWVEAGEDEG